MTIAISISPAPDDIWAIQDGIYELVLESVQQRFLVDPEVVEQVYLAQVTNGVALDLLYRNEGTLALRVRDALKSVAEELGNNPELIAEARVRDALLGLVKMLERFAPALPP